MATGITLPLRASNHQVGGHFLLMELNDQLITKPLVKRERDFYEHVPAALKPFTPQYHGTIQVRFTTREDGSLSYIASSDTTESSTADHVDLHELKCSLESGSTVVPWTGTSYTSPLTRARIQQLSKKKHNSMQKCIVLENLTGRFVCPCVLDLKMGTRAHTDTMSESKIREHVERCSNTTSESLGVRVCGMQVYNVVDGCYHMEDKYYGRKIAGRTELFDSLRKFVHNSKELRVDVIERLVDTLKQLRAIIQQMDSYRFFSTSLLIIYEGVTDHKENGQGPTNHTDVASLNLLPVTTNWSDSIVDVRMIDFVNCTYSGCNDPVVYQGPDNGYLLGINTLISAFESFI